MGRIHRQASTENIGSPKPALPIAMRKNDGPRAPGLIVRCSEDDASPGIHTQHREELERGFRAWTSSGEPAPVIVAVSVVQSATDSKERL